MAFLIRLKLFSMLMFYLLGTLNILATETASTFRHYDCKFLPKFSPKSSYQLNLNKLLSKLTSKVNTTNYYNTTVSGKNKQDTVYGLFMCNGYMEKCGECVNTSIQTLKSKCVFNKEAIIWTHECMVRYSDRFFYNTTEKSPSWCVKNSEDYEGELDIFNRMLSSLMEDLLTEASEAQMGSVKFAVKKITFSQDKHFFGFAQCMPYLSKENCRRCLRDAMNFLQTCAKGKIGGRVIYPSCIVRYDHYLFFPLLRGLNSLQFELSTIQEATNKFSDDNKIGEGGFGAVYKGVFSNGLEIAVKRLKKNSSQGATEFKKEFVNLLLFCSGYMSPEYAMLGQFSMKSDVFSFGVIILEIISGKRNVDGNGKDLDDLLSHAWKKWKKNKVLELLDPSLPHSFSETEIKKCGNPDQRPIMAKIALYISCDQVGKLPLPQEPAFLMLRYEIRLPIRVRSPNPFAKVLSPVPMGGDLEENTLTLKLARSLIRDE
ncbi:hypothetical protein V8G54_034585 [Vigna mungo]|uniref:Gnk2-homologous domain-containing protein n=1 Tax=Vigna mungo TaxID=3915 RepID=A0AAQ3MQS9_VIGMU